VTKKPGTPVAFGRSHSHFAKPWTIRRSVALAIIGWGVGELTYLTAWGTADSLRETIVSSVAMLLSATIGSYIFGATWDNVSERQADVDYMSVNAGIPPNMQGGANIVQQNVGPAMPEPPGNQ
jgi:hypothetical protein